MNERELKRHREAEAARQIEIEDGVKKLFTRWMIRICQTSTIAILGMATWVGSWIANHFPNVMQALKVLFGDGK